MTKLTLWYLSHPEELILHLAGLLAACWIVGRCCWYSGRVMKSRRSGRSIYRRKEAKKMQIHPAKDVAKYLLWLGREDASTTPMQLLKLVYISHGWTLGLLGHPLIAESVEAWQYGPVVPSVYHEYKKFRSNPITAIPSTEPDCFEPDEKDVMRQVWSGYGNYTGVQLSSMTHKPGTPWDVTRRMSGPGAVISNDLIENFYRKLAQSQTPALEKK